MGGDSYSLSLGTVGILKVGTEGVDGTTFIISEKSVNFTSAGGVNSESGMVRVAQSILYLVSSSNPAAVFPVSVFSDC